MEFGPVYDGSISTELASLLLAAQLYCHKQAVNLLSDCLSLYFFDTSHRDKRPIHAGLILGEHFAAR